MLHTFREKSKKEKKRNCRLRDGPVPAKIIISIIFVCVCVQYSNFKLFDSKGGFQFSLIYNIYIYNN